MCVSFAAPALLARHRDELGADVELYADPDRELYGALGLGRASMARVWLDPRVWWRYARLLGAGGRPGRLEQDSLQLGGDAVLDADLRLRFVYRSRGPEDRPAVDRLVAELARAAESGEAGRP